jgi:hypothetical protein
VAARGWVAVFRSAPAFFFALFCGWLLGGDVCIWVCETERESYFFDVAVLQRPCGADGFLLDVLYRSVLSPSSL